MKRNRGRDGVSAGRHREGDNKMALKYILVLVDNDENGPARLQTALALARIH